MIQLSTYKLLLLTLLALVVPIACTRRAFLHAHVMPNLNSNRHINSLLNLRGGAQPTNPSRTYWSPSSSTSTSTQQPTSFQQSQSQALSRQQQTKQMTVTDVTDDLKSEERERTKEEIDSFLTRESRNSFIVRVYSILTVQLLLVALSVLLFGKYPMLGRWMLTKGTFGKCVSGPLSSFV